ncbi:MAG: acetate/propionate family kinase [Kiritimatiellia bacterium]|jgi:acetate kinase
MKKEQYILVFNCGSSSLGCKIFRCAETVQAEPVFSAKAHRVGVEGKEASFLQYQADGTSAKVVVPLPDHRTAARRILEYIRARNVPVDMIGHRFVHGGDFFKESAIIDRGVVELLRQCVPLAPIHNPVSLSVIHECRKTMPGLPAYAVFDTAFHATIPDYAYTYPVPQSIRERFHYRKYGFHGLSYKYIARAAPALLGLPADKARMVVCHLGTGGSSVSAIRNGASQDNSMGYSPLMGLLMSTRCGDIDPMLAIYLAVTYDMRPDDLLNMLTEKSGLLGVAGFSSDLRDIIRGVTGQEDDRAGLALRMYVHRLKKYIGSFVAALGGMDALVFTDDIGVTNWLVREKACEAMQWCGLKLDREANRKASLTDATLVSAADSRIKVLSMPTKEELIIAEEGARLMARREAHDSAV